VSKIQYITQVRKIDSIHNASPPFIYIKGGGVDVRRLGDLGWYKKGFRLVYLVLVGTGLVFRA
jgi:hypothetical protein